MKIYGISVIDYSKFTQEKRIFHARKNARNRIYAHRIKNGVDVLTIMNSNYHLIN